MVRAPAGPPEPSGGPDGDPDSDPDGDPALPSEAQVHALRAELDDIRALLDDVAGRDPDGVPGPVRQEPSPGRERPSVAFRAVAVAVAVAVASAVAVAGFLLARGSWPAREDRPAAGAGVPGTEVVFAPAAGRPGVLVVDESVVLAGRDTASLRLTAPDPARWTGVTVRADVTVTGLRATSGGRPADVRPASGGWVVTEPGGGPLGTVLLSYEVTGAVVPTPGTSPGRVLMLLWPLSAEASGAGGAPVVVRPDPGAVTVRQMLCPLAGPALQLCGAAGPGGWTGRIPLASAAPLVVVQGDAVAP